MTKTVTVIRLLLMALGLATSLGACVYPYARGDGEGWRHGEQHGGGEHWNERGGERR